MCVCVCVCVCVSMFQTNRYTSTFHCVMSFIFSSLTIYAFYILCVNEVVKPKAEYA